MRTRLLAGYVTFRARALTNSDRFSVDPFVLYFASTGRPVNGPLFVFLVANFLHASIQVLKCRPGLALFSDVHSGPGS